MTGHQRRRDRLVLRVPATGVITYQDCISAETGTAGGALHRRARHLRHTAMGPGSTDRSRRWSAPTATTSTSSSNGDASVVWLDRAPNGALTLNDCITGDLDSGPLAATAPAAPRWRRRPRSARAATRGWSGPRPWRSRRTTTTLHRLADRRRGRSVHPERGQRGSDVRRVPERGSEHRRRAPPSRRRPPLGVDSGMNFAQALAISPDGKSVYVAGAGDAAITSFSRDLDNGELELEGVPDRGDAKRLGLLHARRRDRRRLPDPGSADCAAWPSPPDGLGLLAAWPDDASASAFTRQQRAADHDHLARRTRRTTRRRPSASRRTRARSLPVPRRCRAVLRVHLALHDRPSRRRLPYVRGPRPERRPDARSDARLLDLHGRHHRP